MLRHQLDELFGLRLPETIDLAADGAVEELRASIEKQARATQPAVVVGLVDKPRIELVRHRAQVALQAYRRRRPSSRPTFGRRQYAYSYRRPGWAPLGVQIFADRIQRRPIPLSVELGDAPAPQHVVETFSVQIDGRRQPVHVGRRPDDGHAGQLQLPHAQPGPRLRLPADRADAERRVRRAVLRPPRGTSPSTARPSRWPTATSWSRRTRRRWAPWRWPAPGDNFVIQGPPGTGKSQTITNLVADFVAHGKRVLFVCQKRAALDVVHARLRAQGLGEICTLVHDSQAGQEGVRARPARHVRALAGRRRAAGRRRGAPGGADRRDDRRARRGRRVRAGARRACRTCSTG